MDYVHLDEKWFFLYRVKNKYILAPDEQPPYRKSKSKRHIPKVMFLVATARPRFDSKIGLWPFITHEPAKRTS